MKEQTKPMHLSDFILANIEPIMREWEVFARHIWPKLKPGQIVEPVELRDHAVEILQTLALDMNTAQTEHERSEKSQGRGPRGIENVGVDGYARIHGAARTVSGFDLAAVFAEYRALRASVLRLWRASNPHPSELDIDDVTRFNESIDQSLTSAAEAFNAEAERGRIALRESESSFHTLAETIPHLAWAAKADGSIYWYNKRWYEYTGTTLEEMLGWGWQSIHDPNVLPSVVKRWKESIATGQPFDMTFPLRGADGAYRPFLTRVLPLRDEAGRVTRWFGTNTDVSEQLALEQELRAYRAELEQRVEVRTRELEKSQASLRRSERMASMGTLAAGMGHDLANLMLPLGLRVDALAKEPLSPAARADVEGISGALKYLRALATGLRQMAADPTAQPPIEGIDLAGWWDEAKGVVKGVLLRHVQLEAQVPAGLPRVRASKAGLTQAIYNLVQNASEVLANEPSGTVRIIAKLAPPEEKCCAGGVLLTVADDGPGMQPEVAARCFEPYFSTKGRAVSTGMGLALVRGIVDHAGGKVEVTSNPGSGTVFTLHLPPVTKSGSADPNDPEGQSDSIMAVVDVQDARMSMLLGLIMAPLRIEARTGDASIPTDADLWITDPRPASHLEAFIDVESSDGNTDRNAARTILIFDDPPTPTTSNAEHCEGCSAAHMVYAGRSPTMSVLRESLQKVAAHIRATSGLVS